MSTSTQRAWTHILQIPAETLRDLLLCMEAFTRHEDHAPLLEAFPLDGINEAFAGDVTHGSAHMAPSLLGSALRAVSRLADSAHIVTARGHKPTRFTGHCLHSHIASVEVAVMPMQEAP